MNNNMLMKKEIHICEENSNANVLHKIMALSLLSCCVNICLFSFEYVSLWLFLENNDQNLHIAGGKVSPGGNIFLPVGAVTVK